MRPRSPRVELTSSISLLDKVQALCIRLAPHGWGDLLKAHGLDILSSDLRAELLKPLAGIDRHLPGFQDFAIEGQRGVEPGQPALSLLFHALASPQVVMYNGKTMQAFATPAELELIENFVYGIEPPSIQELRLRVNQARLAVVVKQHELMKWWQQSVPKELEETIWPTNPGPPLTLADSLSFSPEWPTEIRVISPSKTICISMSGCSITAC